MRITGPDLLPKKVLVRKKMKNQNRGKTYNAPTNKGRQKASYEKRPNEGEIHVSIKCFKCGGACHRANDCKSSEK